MTEYDFTKPEPIEYDQIEKGMLIMHRDEDGFYLGVADSFHEDGPETWVDVDGRWVADVEEQNYLIPKKPQPLPTASGARIRTLVERFAVPKGSTLTFNACANLWFVDGYVDKVEPGALEGVEWEAIKVVPVDA